MRSKTSQRQRVPARLYPPGPEKSAADSGAAWSKSKSHSRPPSTHGHSIHRDERYNMLRNVGMKQRLVPWYLSLSTRTSSDSRTKSGPDTDLNQLVLCDRTAAFRLFLRPRRQYPGSYPAGHSHAARRSKYTNSLDEILARLKRHLSFDRLVSILQKARMLI